MKRLWQQIKLYGAITLIAMGLAWVSGQVALLLGYDPPPQDLVKIFTDPATPWQMKARLGAIAIVVCPPVEELVFRGFLYRIVCRRYLGRWLNFGWGAALTAILFAAVHLHAATFVPLFFLGFAFAWLYEKSGTLWESIRCHVFFNAVNLALCLLFPNLAN